LPTKHLVIDIDVLINLWLKRANYIFIENMMVLAKKNQVQTWLVASSLVNLDRFAKAEFISSGMAADEANNTVYNLIKNLLLTTKVLSVHGFDQLNIYLKCTNYHDIQIATATQALTGQTIRCWLVQVKSSRTRGYNIMVAS
jgi:hypothetical protein